MNEFLKLVDAKSIEDLPLAGSRTFVFPPHEPELAWISDRSTDMKQRVQAALALYDDTKAIMKRYGARDLAIGSGDPSKAKDGTEALLWAEATIREFGHISVVLISELLPTFSKDDPTYPTRVCCEEA